MVDCAVTPSQGKIAYLWQGSCFHLLYMSLQYCSLLKRGHHACLRENDFDEMPS